MYGLSTRWTAVDLCFPHMLASRQPSLYRIIDEGGAQCISDRAHPDSSTCARTQQLRHLWRIVLAGRHHQQQVHWRQALCDAMEMLSSPTCAIKQ